jgi:2-octaprenyl-3-methyl-6-methoxy-1,4-benzoquinol hydroxylase
MSKQIPSTCLKNHYDIVIVGAGMVGAAMACGLADSGLSILLLDQKLPSPLKLDDLPKIRVSALSAGSEAYLSRLGVWREIKAMRSCVFRRLGVWEHKAQLFPPIPAAIPLQTLFDAKEIGQSHLGHIVENDVTQQALLHKATQYPNVQLHCPAQIQRARFTETEAEIELISNESAPSNSKIVCQLLIGADGAMSKVRQWAHIGQHSSQYQQQALIATVAYEGEQEDITWQAFTSSGPRAFLPLPDIAGKHYASLVWYDQPRRINQLQQQTEAEFIQSLNDHFPDNLPPVSAIIERASFPLVKRHADEYVRPHLALVGDAAHTINPLAGQGVNLGFQDADCLTNLLIKALSDGKNIGDIEILKPYALRRRRDNQKMMAMMDLFYHLFSNDYGPLKTLRNVGFGLAHRFTPGKREVLRYAMGIQNNR